MKRILRFVPSVSSAVAVVALALITSMTGPPPSEAAANRPVVVSLTFDDGVDDIVAAEQVMHKAGMNGTFYITDQWVDQDGFVTLADLTRIAARGNEIGGHTVHHPRLPTVSPEEQVRQICQNRMTLQKWGFRPVSFAYPFASAGDVARQAVADCGYHTGRGLGSIKSTDGCPQCDPAEDMTPSNPLWLRAPAQVHSGTTLEHLQQLVTQASPTGGWVILTFHHICAPIGAPGCPPESSVTPALFSQFVDWLDAYVGSPGNNASVRTIDGHLRQQLGEAYPSYDNARHGPAPGEPDTWENRVTNPSFESVNEETGAPRCFQTGGWGTNKASFTPDAPGHTGAKGHRIDMTGYYSGDAKVLPTLDLGECSPTVEPGDFYDLGAMYRATGSAQFAVYYRTTGGHWRYWTSSPWFDPTDSWTQATWRTPPVPDDAVGLSFGLALITDGTLWVDDYRMVQRLPSGSAIARLR